MMGRRLGERVERTRQKSEAYLVQVNRTFGFSRVLAMALAHRHIVELRVATVRERHGCSRDVRNNSEEPFVKLTGTRTSVLI